MCKNTKFLFYSGLFIIYRRYYVILKFLGHNFLCKRVSPNFALQFVLSKYLLIIFFLRYDSILLQLKCLVWLQSKLLQLLKHYSLGGVNPNQSKGL